MKQDFLNDNFKSEFMYLNSFFSGEGFILGPVTSDHWYFFVADFMQVEHILYSDISINLCLYKIGSSLLDNIDSDSNYLNVFSILFQDKINILSIHPGSTIHSHFFKPHGLIINGLIDQYYWTIYIIKENNVNYVSYEANVHSSNYAVVIQSLLDIFNPSRFSMSLFADNGSFTKDVILPYDVESFHSEEFDMRYFRTICSVSKISNGYRCSVGNWILSNNRDEAKALTMKHNSIYIDENTGEL